MAGLGMQNCGMMMPTAETAGPSPCLVTGPGAINCTLRRMQMGLADAAAERSCRLPACMSGSRSSSYRRGDRAPGRSWPSRGTGESWCWQPACPCCSSCLASTPWCSSPARWLPPAAPQAPRAHSCASAAAIVQGRWHLWRWLASTMLHCDAGRSTTQAASQTLTSAKRRQEAALCCAELQKPGCTVKCALRMH